MEGITAVIGREEELGRLVQRLFDWARRHDYDTVGAVRITCADETERECAETFQHGFVDHVLPRLQIARHAPFAISNLGGRYEPGTVAIAEQHFAALDAEGSRLLARRGIVDWFSPRT